MTDSAPRVPTLRHPPLRDPAKARSGSAGGAAHNGSAVTRCAHRFDPHTAARVAPLGRRRWLWAALVPARRGRVIEEGVMATTAATGGLVRYEDPAEVAERSAVAGFLAGYSGGTKLSYSTDLRLFAEWCAMAGVRLLEARRAHLEVFAREMESEGRMRSTVARRLSTLASFYRYCHVEGLPERNPAANVRPGGTRVAGTVGDPVGGERVAYLRGPRCRHRRPGQRRGHRTLQIVRKGGKNVTIPLAPRTGRALDLYIGERCDGPIFLEPTGYAWIVMPPIAP